MRGMRVISSEGSDGAPNPEFWDALADTMGVSFEHEPVVPGGAVKGIPVERILDSAGAAVVPISHEDIQGMEA
jgi:hypothetical protein